MIKPDKKIFLFVGISFLLSIPTWYIFAVQDEKLHFFIWDMSNLCTISLLPLLGYFCLTDKKRYGIILKLYFILTLLNPLSEFLGFLDLTESWMIGVKFTLWSLVGVFILLRFRYGR